MDKGRLEAFADGVMAVIITIMVLELKASHVPMPQRSPAALYGGGLLMMLIAWPLLARALIACNGHDSPLAVVMEREVKGKVSIVLYALAIALAFIDLRIACALYAAVAIVWLVPDRRIEKVVVS